MQEQNRIIIGGQPEIEVYYVFDGAYKKEKIRSGGQYITEMLNGFEYIQIGNSPALGCFEIKQYPDGAFRISRQLGTGGIIPAAQTKKTNPVCDMLVIYDSAYINSTLLIQAVQQFANKNTKIVYIMLNSDNNNALIKYLADNHLAKLHVITNAEVLRRCGMDIAYGLSWESTVSDLIWQTYAHPTLRAIADSGRLIVRFATEGALRLCGVNSHNVIAFQFMPDSIEGDQFRTHSGDMHDMDVPFVSPILAAMANDETPDAAVISGLKNAYAYYNNGYPITKDGIEYIDKYDQSIDIQSVNLNLDRITQRPGSVWSLLEGDDKPNLEELAKDVVIQGMKKLADVPSARFCSLVTVDRKEIERFRAIRNLMEEYLNTENPARPLSIAIFGTPGSGKSFGVTQIAKCLGKDTIVKAEYNLSQMRTKDELIEAFHSIQDLVLEGKIPLVFFDEFDSDKDGVALGWLKSFLAPMQDGEFTHNGVHPIGKCIFIFAGGIFSTFDAFCEKQSNTGAKVRDFISRLRGYVNIQGPNPNPSPQQDNAYILRRAVLLRSLIERKLKKIKAADGTARIDEDIVKAMLRVPNFRHGVRSMEAVIDMSTVSGQSYWDKADLPPVDQLAIHVDQDQFKHLLLVNQLLASYREDIARAIHARYLKSLETQPEAARTNNPNNCPWNELSTEFREDNRLQADDFVGKLLSINCSIEPVSMSANDFAFTKNEVEQLAKNEHDRWISNKLKSGWTYGKTKDIGKKISPYLLPWEELDEKARNLDREPIRNIPNLLKEANLSIYRIK